MTTPEKNILSEKFCSISIATRKHIFIIYMFLFIPVFGDSLFGLVHFIDDTLQTIYLMPKSMLFYVSYIAVYV